MIINNYSDFQPIGCYQPITCTGTNGYLVNNPHGEYSLLLIAFDMGDVPANLIVDTAIGKVPLEMKIYMDRPSEILPRVYRLWNRRNRQGTQSMDGFGCYGRTCLYLLMDVFFA